MSHKYRVNIGIRSAPGFTWDRDARKQFELNCLSDGDKIKWVKGTVMIDTNDPDKILDAMLDHDYSVTEDSVLRWINVGAAETA